MQPCHGAAGWLHGLVYVRVGSVQSAQARSRSCCVQRGINRLLWGNVVLPANVVSKVVVVVVIIIVLWIGSRAGVLGEVRAAHWACPSLSQPGQQAHAVITVSASRCGHHVVGFEQRLANGAQVLKIVVDVRLGSQDHQQCKCERALKQQETPSTHLSLIHI